MLGASGLSDTVKKVKINNCNAYELEIEITSSYGDDHRSVIGAFVGKTDQGKVVITGAQGGSYAKIKSLRIGITNNNRCVAGGLVGYAGNGCDVSNMTICPADSLGTNASITIGDKIAMAGGIVGLMQPQNNSGTANFTATFVNCTVKNVNVSAKIFAGGFYGGTWDDNKKWVPEKITIDNCRLIGCSSTNHNEVYGEIYAGGFVGNGRVLKNTSPNIEISNSTISNYDIVSVNDKYVGGFIGQADAEENGASVTCYVHDSAIENCKLGGNNNNYAGGVIGNIVQNADNKILGYNVKLSDITSGKAERMGAWVGYATSDTDTMKTTIQLVGMAIYGTGFEKMLVTMQHSKTTPSSSPIMTASAEEQHQTAIRPILRTYPATTTHLDTHVAMPEYPYVNINPQSSMGTGAYISGDGAVMYGSSVTGYSGKTADKTMAALIYSEKDNTDTNKQYYSTFSDDEIYGGKTINDYMQLTQSQEGDKISTYKNVRSTYTGTPDFAVIVITNTQDKETTNLINRYIQLVTNTTNDYTLDNPYYNVDIKTCKYSEGKFIIDASRENHGLTFTKGTATVSGSFALNGAFADDNNMGEDTFTLVDVQFKDPLYTNKIAYHLYVPVYTIKQMTFGFSSVALSDTNSVKYQLPTVNSEYETEMSGSNRLLVDSLNTWVTQYVRFSYNAEDLNMLLASGNLNWNFDKYVTFETRELSYKIPGNTYMVLVDPNGDADKVYYASASDFTPIGSGDFDVGTGWKIDLGRFIKSDGETTFSPSSFNKLIARDIIETPSATGRYSELTFAENYEVKESDYDVFRIDSNGTRHYYEYVSSGTGSCDLSVPTKLADDTPDDDTDNPLYVLNEDYYISMYVPKPSEYNYELYYYTINSPGQLTCARSAARSSNSTFNVLPADLYDQTTSYNVLPDNQVIDDAHKQITVNAQTKITIKNTNAPQYLRGRSLYHAFDLLLNNHGEDGTVSSEIVGLSSSNVIASYTLSNGKTGNCTVDPPENYVLVKTTDIMDDLINANAQTLTVTADIEMNFTDVTEFPEKSTSNPGVGVNVAATSNLAYDSDHLAYISMTKSFDDNDKYYYREALNVSRLSYKAVSELDQYDEIGKDSKNYSRLGINGRTSERTAMLINSAAELNASAIDDVSYNKTAKIRFTMTLNKKVDTRSGTTITKADYAQVTDISNYLSDITMKVGDVNSVKLASSTADTYIYEATITPSNDKIYNANISYKVRTGNGFTEYANYQVVLQAELLDSTGETIGNRPSDYLVYTNAKVYPTVIEE